MGLYLRNQSNEWDSVRAFTRDSSVLFYDDQHQAYMTAILPFIFRNAEAPAGCHRRPFHHQRHILRSLNAGPIIDRFGRKWVMLARCPTGPAI